MYWILGVVAALALFCCYIINRYSYWSKRGVQQKSPIHQIIFSLRMFLQTDSQAAIFKALHDNFPQCRFYGSYQLFQPVLHIRDPDLIKQITVNDFEHFVDHSQVVPEELDPLWGKNLFSLQGDQWRDMRATINPFFTNANIRSMFISINEGAQKLVCHFQNEKTPKLVDMKDALSRYTTDMFATVLFGHTCDTLNKANNEFYLMAREATYLGGLWTNIKFFVVLVSPTLGKFLGFTVFSKRVRNFFQKLVKTNIELREKSEIVKPDIIHLLMEAKKCRPKYIDKAGISTAGKKEQHINKPLTNEDLTAQVLIFLFAGFQTITTLICFLIYEIVINPNIQDMLRKEIDQILKENDGCVTFELLHNMKYMNMVVLETLRKWPSTVGIDRICTKQYTIKPQGIEKKEIRLRKNDLVFMDLYALHRNSQFYIDPDRFNPERFNDKNIIEMNPNAYIAFGVGPRSCIGNTFALLVTKTIIFHLIANLEIVVSAKTPIPIKVAKDQYNISAKNGFWFEIKPRNS